MADSRPRLLASDLEGVLVPEIWIAFAEKTGIEQLRLTTRDVSDYDQLMKMRLKILKERKLRLQDIQEVIATISPLPGAGQFVDWVRERAQFIVLSDTFYEFAKPLMAQLGYPTIFCHSLEVDAAGTITGYRLRLDQSKRKAISAFGDLKFQTLAIGDSYNDIAMLKRADLGILFDPPANVIEDHPDLPVVRNYCEAQAIIEDWLLDRG
ncbi:MAG: bifunctional phosphoserine phosphatase/homoserine phosphotransferase ThrH [Caldilineaceae bacterium]|nr:bifunctional phosphoserine phosphatase/homoserine phosphotransferase ThrH [Caldilineaceae bacterium]MDE0077606.1 bifunctional phosphoserine phosphatase/homoserine phosphotransferase ThrH [Caldilineaceae bacterium]MDE0312114.1 bifunctional phosphoserine phosphatase/homoserine phosphotransferase ThrH [Caldilineaceae bacterium]